MHEFWEEFTLYDPNFDFFPDFRVSLRNCIYLYKADNVETFVLKTQDCLFSHYIIMQSIEGFLLLTGLVLLPETQSNPLPPSTSIISVIRGEEGQWEVKPGVSVEWNLGDVWNHWLVIGGI